MGGLCPLFFDGAVCQFEELPRPDDQVGINKVYNYLNRIRSNHTPNKTFFTYGIRKINKGLRIKKLFSKFATLFK